jgi:AraC-like DNA-binding protein
MDLTCEERLSDSPYIEFIWRSHSEHPGAFISMAEMHCSMVVTKINGKTIVTVRGPEIRATPAYSPDGAEFFGIVFKPGTFMPHFPPSMVADRHDVNLPGTSGKSFWLQGSAWQFPDFENADVFANRLVHEGLLIHDPVVNSVLRREPVDLSQRTVQRRFLQATGLTYGDVRQIERARYATRLLRQGVPILDTVYEAGYFDQPHLTRSLKHLIGQTPAQLLDKDRSQRLSLLYKTVSSGASMIQMFDYKPKETAYEVPNLHKRHRRSSDRRRVGSA